jgi:hypothetical protein
MSFIRELFKEIFSWFDLFGKFRQIISCVFLVIPFASVLWAHFLSHLPFSIVLLIFLLTGSTLLSILCFMTVLNRLVKHEIGALNKVQLGLFILGLFNGIGLSAVFYGFVHAGKLESFVYSQAPVTVVSSPVTQFVEKYSIADAVSQLEDFRTDGINLLTYCNDINGGYAPVTYAFLKSSFYAETRKFLISYPVLVENERYGQWSGNGDRRGEGFENGGSSYHEDHENLPKMAQSANGDCNPDFADVLNRLSKINFYIRVLKKDMKERAKSLQP